MNFIFQIANSLFSSNPKAYYAIDFDTQEYKRSSKGVQHRIALSYEDFKSVVYENREMEVQNVSIRSFNNQMSTVKQKKTGLRNVFVKSFVENDCVTIKPFTKFT